MVWSITDSVVEDAKVRAQQFHELHEAGFGGVAAFVRCSRYSWDDPPAHAALVHISRLCRQRGMKFWFGPDPRFVSHTLAGSTDGLELLLFGNSTRADVRPNLSPISRGKYSVRCMLSPRHVHTLTDVAIEYRPLSLAGVYAVRLPEGGAGVAAIRDITRSARMFHNARDGYVEAFGQASVPAGESWDVLAFFHVRSTHFDFSNAGQLARYERMLERLKRSGCRMQGVMWDEPGYTCTYGSLPYSPWIRGRYHADTGRQLESDLWKLALDGMNQNHVAARRAYYSAVQSSITRAEKKLASSVRRIWGPATAIGIHDTWHFESADMCDMNHGSMDLWKTVGAKSGGFVDLGAVQQLKDPASPWNANHAALTVIAASLGRQSVGGYAYNNLWTVGDDDGDGSQREAMEYCVKIMALFGIRWLAHAFGPVGTIGQERTFLGSPPLPGYPDHSTWKEFPAWNRFLMGEGANVEGRLPMANLLVIYPVETLYALADQRADRAAAKIFSLLLGLLDRHYHPEVISSTCLHGGRWQSDAFRCRGKKYDVAVIPYPSALPRGMLRLLQGNARRTLFAFEPSPLPMKKGTIENHGASPGIEETLERLESFPELRPAQCPDGAWITITPTGDGPVVSLAPARCGGRYGGVVGFAGRDTTVGETGGLTRIVFPPTGQPRKISP